MPKKEWKVGDIGWIVNYDTNKAEKVTVQTREITPNFLWGVTKNGHWHALEKVRRTKQEALYYAVQDNKKRLSLEKRLHDMTTKAIKRDLQKFSIEYAKAKREKEG